MKPLLDIVTTICIGLLIGTEFAVSVFINPILRRLGPREELRAIRLFALRLGAAMPVWYGVGFLLLIAEAIFRHGEAGSLLVIAAGAIWATVIILTVLFLVPINNRLALVDPDAPPDSALKEHGRWDAMHRLRVATLTAAMICFLIAVVRVG
jgi:uncharacterized membrane protein